MKQLVLILMLVACGGDDSGGGSGGGGGATDGGNDSGTGSGTDSGGGGGDAAHQACITETNMYRALKSKPALVRSAQLEAYADTGAMVDFSSSPHHHFMSTNGGGLAMAENECPQQLGWTVGSDIVATVKMCVKAYYDEGPGGGHYENMMGAYTKIGCGIYQSGEKITILQDFGN